MTQATFDRYYLRRGQPAGATLALAEPPLDGRLKRALLRSRLKRAFS